MSTEALTNRRALSDAPDEPRSLGRVIASLSRQLNAERIGVGALAELRRMTGDLLPPAFWRLYLWDDVPVELREPRGHVDEGVDRAWAALIRAMVEMAPNPHSFEKTFGAALAETGYSEDRFVRLLRAKGDDLARELRVAGAWLSRAGVKADWERPARLLLRCLGPSVKHQIASHRMARDYFRVAASDHRTNKEITIMKARFLQLHSLTGYSATLLNRDDIGRAKRLPFGGYDRIRVSSQCLKRHWREATGEWSLQELGSGKSTRSRRVFSDVIAGRLRDRGLSENQIVNVLMPIRAAVLGESIKAKQARQEQSAEDADPFAGLHTDQVIVLGEPEIAFLTELAAELVNDDTEGTAKAVEAYFKDKAKKANLKALKKGSGLDAAIFGRMVTSDLMARTDAAVHVAHSFTVHAEEAEPDYFSALDDLVAAKGELGSAHINTSELTSGLFYTYVVVDVRLLVDNLSGDGALAAEVLSRLVHLIATVSPGAKLGATAPYACAELMLAETGARQPRTLANAFMKPVSKQGAKEKAAAAMGEYLGRYDAMYGTHEGRRIATMIEPAPEHTGERVTMDALAQWAADQVGGASLCRR